MSKSTSFLYQLAVATLITLAPVLVVIGFAHQHIRRGILAGATKG
jgi:ABC-type glycerol-3-phosphate transport system permease component